MGYHLKRGVSLMVEIRNRWEFRTRKNFLCLNKSEKCGKSCYWIHYSFDIRNRFFLPIIFASDEPVWPPVSLKLACCSDAISIGCVLSLVNIQNQVLVFNRFKYGRTPPPHTHSPQSNFFRFHRFRLRTISGVSHLVATNKHELIKLC